MRFGVSCARLCGWVVGRGECMLCVGGGMTRASREFMGRRRLSSPADGDVLPHTAVTSRHNQVRFDPDRSSAAASLGLGTRAALQARLPSTRVLCVLVSGGTALTGTLWAPPPQRTGSRCGCQTRRPAVPAGQQLLCPDCLQRGWRRRGPTDMGRAVCDSVASPAARAGVGRHHTPRCALSPRAEPESAASWPAWTSL